jgi:hypothetical protein
MQKFSTEVLIQYLYGETPQQLTIAIEEALQEDFMLFDELNTLKRTLHQLNTINLQSPRKASVNAILNYAKTTETIVEE